MANGKTCLGAEGQPCQKQPAFGVDGHTAKYCSKHRLQGHVNVRNRRCNAATCIKEPYFGEQLSDQFDTRAVAMLSIACANAVLRVLLFLQATRARSRSSAALTSCLRCWTLDTDGVNSRAA
jgi:EsV-1-7 cysteine-rich motif